MAYYDRNNEMPSHHSNYPYPNYAENTFQNHYNGYKWSTIKGNTSYQDRGFRRPAPMELPFVEFDPHINRWMQGPNALPRSFKPKKYWARPVDGKRRGAWGRLLDGITGQGPDVFVVFNGDRRTLMRDMPHRAQWSGWKGRRWDVNFDAEQWDPDWTVGEGVHFSRPRASREAQFYNYRTRSYKGRARTRRDHERGLLWTDVQWPHAGDWNQGPVTYRDGWNESFGRVPAWAERFAGGRPVNR